MQMTEKQRQSQCENIKMEQRTVGKTHKKDKMKTKENDEKSPTGGNKGAKKRRIKVLGQIKVTLSCNGTSLNY